MQPNPILLLTTTLLLAGTACAGPAPAPEQPSTPPPATTSASPSATSAASPTPVSDAAIATQFLAKREQFGACQDEYRPLENNQGTVAYRINDQTYLVQVQCFLAAYQGNYEFFAYAPATDTAKKLTVTQYSQDEQGQWQKAENPSVGGLPDFDATTQTLIINTKYRGLGDCGSVGTYTFAENSLKLTEFKAKAECDGKMEPFVTVYPQ